MAPTSQPKTWMRATKAATLERRPDGAAEALRVFRKELDLEQRLAVADEIAETRGAELCRAYANVIDIGAGYRTRRDKKGRQRTGKEVAVTFHVSRKWKGDRDGKARDLIPKELFTYVSIKGRRKLCAVPTDVSDANDDGPAETEAPRRRVRVKPPSPLVSGNGSITCIIKRRERDNTVFAISCRHVFSLSRRYHQRAYEAWPIRDFNNNSRIGTTRRIRGALQNSPALSLDAQLCRVTDLAALREVMGNLRFAGVASSPSTLPASMRIVTSHGLIKVKAVGRFSRSLPYSHPSLRQVVHRTLIKTEFVRRGMATKKGDSGSPLVTPGPNPILIGMHIARSKNGKYAYAIPAADFLNPNLYEGASAREKWRVVNP